MEKKNVTSFKLDSLKSDKSLVVIKGRLINFEGGNKYHYSQVKVAEVLLNKTSYKLKDTIRVANYNWYESVPEHKDCIIYLTPWPLGSKELNKSNDWMLIDGNGNYACECK